MSLSPYHILMLSLAKSFCMPVVRDVRMHAVRASV